MDMTGKNNPQYGKKGKNSARFKDYILQLDEDNNIIGRFESLDSAAQAVNGDFSTIRKCLIHTRKHHKGFKWVYEQEFLNNDMV